MWTESEQDLLLADTRQVFLNEITANALLNGSVLINYLKFLRKCIISKHKELEEIVKFSFTQKSVFLDNNDFKQAKLNWLTF